MYGYRVKYPAAGYIHPAIVISHSKMLKPNCTASSLNMLVCVQPLPNYEMGWQLPPMDASHCMNATASSKCTWIALSPWEMGYSFCALNSSKLAWLPRVFSKSNANVHCLHFPWLLAL